MLGKPLLGGINWLVFPKYTKITLEEPGMGSRGGSEKMNASWDIESDVPGIHFDRSS